jgi:hypothetical protein
MIKPAPGDPAVRASADVAERTRHEMGLEQPAVVELWRDAPSRR